MAHRTDGAPPLLTPAECRYEITPGYQAECYYLIVPEARDAASGRSALRRTLRLYVTLVRSPNPSPAPDPVVFLYGGPGGSSGGLLRNLDLVADLLADRDLIIFDQRGTGYAEPRLDCPEADEQAARDAEELLSVEERTQRYVAAALRCRERLAAAGINLKAFNTIESAADIEDVRRALGYERINLFGVSYGTRLALAAMRDAPTAIRSVILDSTVPMQVSQYAEGAANTAHAFESLFAGVAADPAAAAAYPDLAARFAALVARLNATPLWLSLPRADGDPARVPLTGELLTGVIYGLFYSTPAIPTIPCLISDVERGELSRISELAAGVFDGATHGSSLGMYYCVNCCDDKVTPTLAAELAAQAARWPAFDAVPLTEFHLGAAIVDLCAGWGARVAGPAEHAPVVSAIPTLILAGEFDQNTPARWGRLAGESLGNSQYVDIPGAGHGVFRVGGCVSELIRAFVRAPQQPLDTRCVASIPPPNFTPA